GAELEACLITEGATIEACLVTEGATFFVNEGIAVNDNTGVTEISGTELESSSSTTSFGRSEDENRSSDKDSSRNDADTDIGPSYDSDAVTEAPHLNNDTFENLFAHGIQSHEQPESILDTYEVNENNSNIISDVPNMDPDRDKEEHDDVNYEQQRAFFASLINNLKCDVNKCNEVNREAQQVNALLTNELERYKEKEKHFAKDKTIESEYCKKIKLLNDKISNLKSQACEKDKTFAKKIKSMMKPPKVPLKRRNVNLKKPMEQTQNLKDHLELAQLRNYDPKLWNSLPMNYFCYVKQAMLKFEKQTFSKQELNQDELFRLNFEHSIEHNVNKRVRNRLSGEFEPLVKNVNLQLNCFEKSLVKEMKDDLKYVMSLEEEFDEACLILDIQQEFFKTRFESVKSESYIHVYENEMFEQNSALENENRCLKMTISNIQKS
ncbi:hypothetical protein Tco_0960973, partial [Tanacetum coccineum]